MKQMPSRLNQLTVFTASALVAISLQAQSAHPPKPDTVEDCLRRQMKELHIPGMQVAVIHRGKIILEGVYGIANLQDSIPVTKTTVFPINSIAKAFTGVAVMQLVEAGKLDLAAPVSQYLDGLPQPWQVVTLRQLLTHNSGIPNILNNDTGRLVADSEDAAWAKVQTMPMEFATGEKFSYSQTNYLLLGRIIDKFSGEPFIRFINEKQLQVVGMPLTSFGDAHVVIPHSARDYSLVYGPDGKTRFNNLFEEFAPSILTATGMNSTADEMAHWILALQQGKLFKDKASLGILWTPGRLNNGKTAGFSEMMNGYALGWPAHRAPLTLGCGSPSAADAPRALHLPGRRPHHHRLDPTNRRNFPGNAFIDEVTLRSLHPRLEILDRFRLPASRQVVPRRSHATRRLPPFGGSCERCKIPAIAK